MHDEGFRGSLDELPLDSVLATLADGGRTGVLRVGGTSEIWMVAGDVALVVAPTGADVVSLLYGGDVGTIDEITKRLDTDREVAAALVEAYPDAAGPLTRLFHEHNLNLLFELLVPSNASFAFEADAEHPIGGRFAEPTLELIEQAKRRLEIWSQIATRIPSTEAVFRLAQNLPDGASERVVTADEWRYLSLLDGHRSVADVITITQASAFRVCSSLYRLLLEGLVEEGAAA